jgi:2-phospho-L-lactate/phosphoenolpyruvate guanylyltransferase
MIWAVVPIKSFLMAKQRLAAALPPAARRRLAEAMAEDVLAALAASTELAGILVVTADADAARLALRFGARVSARNAEAGHTAAVTGAARDLADAGCTTMLTVPGDIPLLAPGDVAALVAAHGPAPAFTITPSHDELGSNAILCSPPEAVPLRFGDDSFRPHLVAATACGITPRVVHLPRVARDVDQPEDLEALLRMRPGGRTLEALSSIDLVPHRRNAWPSFDTSSPS